MRIAQAHQTHSWSCHGQNWAAPPFYHIRTWLDRGVWVVGHTELVRAPFPKEEAAKAESISLDTFVGKGFPHD